MIIESSQSGGKRPTQSPDAEDNNDQLRLNPGAPERKPRSAGKFCLWFIVILVCLVGGTAVYFFIKRLLYHLQHPHSSMYYEGSEDDISDWSSVVQPMIGKKDSFDIVASVWVRDDDEEGKGKDGGIYVDGGERPERLIYSDVVFRDLDLKSKIKFKNVKLRVPMSHFKKRNISNYDLRASFVLVQSHSPAWHERAQNFMTWKPDSLHSPIVRPLGPHPNLTDDIYNSFGFTIPLIQFHNITSRINGSLEVTTTEVVGEEQVVEWDEAADLLEEAGDEMSRKRKAHDVLDIFGLEFTSDKKPVTQQHPYIVSRTHLGIVDETHFFKRVPYTHTLKQLVNMSCIPPTDPRWHQCNRMYFAHGVFETRVQMAPRPGNSAQRRNMFEFLYAPYLSAVKRSAGPKDLIPMRIDREALHEIPASNPPTSAEEYMNVTWKLSFRPSSPGKHFMQSWMRGLPEFNMTASDNELAHEQYSHEAHLGLFGYRSDENAHPRRAFLLGFISSFIRVICFFLTIHYWYTRTSTAGISRLGTALMAFYHLLDANEAMITSVFDPVREGTLAIAAVSRLEFGSLGRNRRSGPIPGVYFARATHSEKISERIEKRLSKRTRILFLVTLFGVAHLFAGPYTYFVTPSIPPPQPKAHPLHSLSDHVPTILQHIYSLGLTLELGGTILQFVMNASSRSYAGKYKIAAVLMFVANALLFLDLLPHVVGTSVRIGGVLVRDALGLTVSAIDLAQAVKYRNVKSSDGDGMED